ncbi:MAG TPA: sigma-70 family RNA polymerase sigma factor [Planctomycetota bacterium]|nr:sigma-70 family RNA polymerase sigma factor [Planctomycetota bacterium]
MSERAEQEVSRLVTQVSSGDPGAVGELLERYLADLRAYVGKHTGPQLAGKETPADLVQSVCREVLEGMQRGAFEFRGEAQFRQWLYQAALHKIQMKARYFGAERRAGHREQPLGDGGSQAGMTPQVSRTPSRSAAEREERQLFRQAMQQLSPPQRQIVEWAHLEGLSHKDIGARLGITEANSRMMLSRALARLARIAARE